MEITALVLSEHEVMRREFTALDGLTGAELASAWTSLASALEIHALAEERLFYPLLADAGTSGRDETVTGVDEHNTIRAAVRAVSAEPGTELWWEQVSNAREVNAEHMTLEERDFFPDFREAVPEARRDELGLQWLAFHDQAISSNPQVGADPDPMAVADADVPSAQDDLGDDAP